MGLSMTIGNFAGFIAPIVMGAITDENVRYEICFLGICVLDQSFFQQTHEAWGQVFLLAAGIYIGCNIIFVLFGSGSVQHWNNPEADNEVAEDKKREIKREMMSIIDEVIKTP